MCQLALVFWSAKISTIRLQQNEVFPQLKRENTFPRVFDHHPEALVTTSSQFSLRLSQEDRVDFSDSPHPESVAHCSLNLKLEKKKEPTEAIIGCQPESDSADPDWKRKTKNKGTFFPQSFCSKQSIFGKKTQDRVGGCLALVVSTEMRLLFLFLAQKHKFYKSYCDVLLNTTIMQLLQNSLFP